MKEQTDLSGELQEIEDTNAKLHTFNLTTEEVEYLFLCLQKVADQDLDGELIMLPIGWSLYNTFDKVLKFPT